MNIGYLYYKKIAFLILLVFCITSCSSAEDMQQPVAPPAASVAQETGKKVELAGFLFNEPVPAGNYYFVLRAVLNFGTPWGSVPSNDEQLEERLWTDLLLSYEAHRQGITVSREELDEEIASMLKSRKVAFDWKNDPGAYAAWVDETMKIEVEYFENLVQHLTQLKKLRQGIIDAAEVTVTEEQCRKKFLDEYHTLSVELAQFETKQEAQEFYRKVKENPQLWEQGVEKDNEIEDKKERRFRKPGFVALDFLMHMWKFPRKAVYEMIGMDAGEFYPPQPIYKGYGVFKILETRPADESEFPKRRTYYEDKLRVHEKNKVFYYWRKDLYEKANIRKLLKPPDGIFQKVEQ
jgi:hypothetical protein